MRIREIAQSRVRYGYRKTRVLLNRESWTVGTYLVYRLYKEEGLTLKKRQNASEKQCGIRKSALSRRRQTRRGASTSLPINSMMERASGR